MLNIFILVNVMHMEAVGSQRESLVRENWDRGKPFGGKIGAKSGQNPAKFGAKSGKSEQIWIKTYVKYLNIPGIQP